MLVHGAFSRSGVHQAWAETCESFPKSDCHRQVFNDRLPSLSSSSCAPKAEVSRGSLKNGVGTGKEINLGVEKGEKD